MEERCKTTGGLARGAGATARKLTVWGVCIEQGTGFLHTLQDGTRTDVTIQRWNLRDWKMGLMQREK